MSRTRIGLLVVGHVDSKSTHVAGDYPELFTQLLAPFGIDLATYHLDVGQFPGRLNECDGWICSPSRLSTYDPVDWLSDAEELLRRIIAAETPYVGICFGHQLLAQALGGKVERSAAGWGIGVRDFEVLTPQRWMTPARASISLIGSHQDQVVRLPDDASPLFRSGYCPNGGFMVGERAWTIQVHPEFVPGLADHLLAGRTELIGPAPVAAARATLTRPLDRFLVASWISQFFNGTR